MLGSIKSMRAAADLLGQTDLIMAARRQGDRLNGARCGATGNEQLVAGLRSQASTQATRDVKHIF